MIRQLSAGCQDPGAPCMALPGLAVCPWATASCQVGHLQNTVCGVAFLCCQRGVRAEGALVACWSAGTLCRACRNESERLSGEKLLCLEALEDVGEEEEKG